MRGKVFFILSLLVAGIVYRFVLASFASPKLEWDSLYYSSYANMIANGDLRANCCNIGMGYPIFLAGIYSVWGKDNVWAVRIVQIAIDMVTAFILYRTVLSISGRNAAVWSFILYIFNPFTAAYTGHVLTETLTIFFLVCAVFILSLKRFVTNPSLWFLLGAVLGLATFVKVSLFQFCLVLMAVFAVLFFRRLTKIVFVTMFAAGYILTSLYSIYTIHESYGAWAIVPPYRIFGASLYASYYRSRSGEMMGEWVPSSAELDAYFAEYFTYYNDMPTRMPEFEKKYTERFKEKFSTEWPAYFRFVAKNIAWIWDKYHLYVYRDPFFPQDTPVLRILNILFLLVHAAGFVTYAAKKRLAGTGGPVVIYTGVLFLFITFAYTLINNETRLSIPYYPFIMMWGGIGIMTISNIKDQISNIKSQKSNSNHTQKNGK